MTPDKITVLVGGSILRRWKSYDIAADLFQPPAQFSLEMGRVDDDTMGLLDEGAPVEIHVEVDGVDQTLISGRIETREHSYSKGQHSIYVSGYDGAHDMQSSSAPFDLEVKDRQFIDVVTDLVGPWGYSVVLSNEVSRWLTASAPNWKKLLPPGMTKQAYYTQIKALQIANTTAAGFKAAVKAAGLPVPPFVHDGICKKVADAKVDPGESVWDFLVRVANKAETFLWFSPDGMLTISRPQYEQDPIYILSHRPDRPTENNVIEASETRSIDGIPTTVTVHGKVREKGKQRFPYAASRTLPTTAAAVRDYGLRRPLSSKDKDARTPDELEKRAYYMAKDAEKNHHSLSYTVAGHSQGGKVWTYDTTCRVIDETLGLDGVYYITGYRMSRSRTGNSAGPQQTILTLSDLDVWTPAP